MKITFIMPGIGVSGGNRVIYEYANRLIERGHIVNLIYPPVMHSIFDRLNKFIYSLLGKVKKPKSKKIGWFKVKTEALEVPTLEAKFIPDADRVIATSWDTAHWVAGYPPSKGEKFYFIQQYEDWGRPLKKVNETYKLPLKKIVIATWLKEKMEKDFKEKVAGLVVNGINLEHFYNDSKSYHDPRRIGMMWHPWEGKGCADGFHAYYMAREKYPDIKMVLFSAFKPPKGFIPKDSEFHFDPPQDKLREIYCSLDIFLAPSTSEGCHLPPMEAMACRCAVVATNVGGIPDYAVAGKTALVSPPSDPKAMGENLIKLLDDENLLKDISEAGYQQIKDFTWDKATERFERILCGS